MNISKLLHSINMCPQKFTFEVNNKGQNMAYLDKNGVYHITVSPQLYVAVDESGNQRITTQPTNIKVTDPQILAEFTEGVIMHELFHLYRGDINKIVNNEEYDQYIYNIASDIIINSYLKEYDIIQKTGITWEKMRGKYPDIPPIVCGTEVIYNYLLKKQNEEKGEFEKNIKEIGENLDPQRKYENKDGELKDINEANSNGDSSAVDESLDSLRIWGKEILKHNNTGLGKGAGTEKGGSDKIPPIKKNQLSPELKRAINIVHQLIQHTYRLRRFHKRIPSGDARILKVQSKKNYVPDIDIYIDVSGSIGDKVVEILSGYNLLPQNRLWVFSDEVRTIKELNEIIDGGTLWEPIRENIQKHKQQTVVIISDFYFADASAEEIRAQLSQMKVKHIFIDINENEN
ncbi:MAG: hypothetical protein D6735_10605 [Acidobacteria bacterium]|nr:MAG: hypothetical protein D6735_10605 [Acidobacteriota bacterium]